MTKKIVMIAIAAVLTLALVAGATSFYAIRNAQAKGIQIEQELSSVFQSIASSSTDSDTELADIGFRRPRPSPNMERFEGINDLDQSFLAEALGISLEDLEAARQAAWENGLAELVDAGEITQAQADRLKDLGLGKLGFAARIGGWMMPETGLDYDVLLAQQLGLSVEDLQAARGKAKDLAMQAAVEAGKITQEQADLVQAREALQPYLDREILTAKVLGLSVEELRAAREAGTSLQDLLADKGLSALDFQKALLDAYQAAIEQAVQDGAITQELADQLLNRGLMGGLRMPGIDRFSMPGMDGRRPGDRGSMYSPPTQPESVDPTSDL